MALVITKIVIVVSFSGTVAILFINGEKCNLSIWESGCQFKHIDSQYIAV